MDKRPGKKPLEQRIALQLAKRKPQVRRSRGSIRGTRAVRNFETSSDEKATPTDE